MSAELEGESLDPVVFFAGYATAADNGIVATIYTDVAIEMLRVCGVSVDAAREIFAQASYDVEQDFPLMPLDAQRALAARRVSRLVKRGIARIAEAALEAPSTGVAA